MVELVRSYSKRDAQRDQFTKRLAKLDDKESYWLDLAAEEGWPKAMLREKVAKLREERASIQRQLEASTEQRDVARRVFSCALDLLSDPEATYRAGNETVQSLLNKVFFTRLYVDAAKAQVTGHELQEPFDGILGTYRLYQSDGTRSYHRRSLPDIERTAVPDGDGGSDVQTSLTDALDRELCVRVSSKPVLVGDEGFEPPTSSV